MPTNKHEFDFSSSALVAFDAVLVGGGGAYPDRGGGWRSRRKRRKWDRKSAYPDRGVGGGS